MGKKNEYILGVNQTELERLEFQNKVWKKVTDDFLDKTGLSKGWKCMDVGSGPGYVSMDLRERIGDSGELTVIEPSEFYITYFKNYCDKLNWKNIKFINENFEDVNTGDELFDLIYLRWVIDFVPEPEKYLLKLLSCLKKGGIIAVQDYAYEGITFFPIGGALDNLADAVRNYWRAGGGDPHFTLKIPSIFRKNKIELIDFSPIIKAVGPESGVYEWANKFLSVHINLMKEKNVISEQECEDMLKDWKNHKNNPDSVFLTPVIMNVIGKKL